MKLRSNVCAALLWLSTLFATANCKGSAPAGPPAAPLPIANVFSPNAVTISTSEGAPYGDCDFWTQDAAGCIQEGQSNFGTGPTKVMRLYICLSGEVELNSCSQQPAVTGPLSAAMVSDINTRVAAYAKSGVRLMVRFVYNFGPIGPSAMDAPAAVISGHIDQVAPGLLANQDLIFSLEAGFIGTWGEWHDSTNGNDAPAPQKIVLDKELALFGGAFPILVRYPAHLIQYTGNSTPETAFGLHDDYYASSGDDGATWNACVEGVGSCSPGQTAAQMQSYAAAVSTTSMFAGEFGALYPMQQSCSALFDYSYTYHLQSLSLFPPSDLAAELQSEGCALTFFNQVGTRIELQSASISGNATPNGQLEVSLVLINTGFGRVIRARPATLLLLSNGAVATQFSIPLASLDLRLLASSATPSAQTFHFSVPLPANFPSSGSIAAKLLIPDPAPSLQSQAAYALPLNSVDAAGASVFDVPTGTNALGTFEAE